MRNGYGIDIALLTCGQHEPHGTSQASNGHMNLGAQATARAADRLIFRPPFLAPASVLVGSDDGGVDDQIFEVRIIGHRLEDPPPNTLEAPTTQATEYTVPIPERF